jgi:dihydropteroate synthase
MGVLNLTPDSFSDGGELLTAGGDVDVARVRAVAARMVDDGASVLDLGAESTRPGAGPVPLAVQRARVLPALAALSGLGAVLSVDTSEPELMRAACEHGAGMINDVRALARPGALAAVAASGAAVVVMHMQREPGTMQQAPAYGDVVADVRAFLAERVAACVGAGIDHGRVVADPGFGFGKTLAHNLALLARLGELATLGVPIAVGLSRKRSIGELTGVGVARDRVAGSVAAAVLAVLGGARLVRVHDVAATTAALKVAWAVRQARQSG